MNSKWIDYFIILCSGLFDARYYLKDNRDCRLADIDPLIHFVRFGWKEGRNPSPVFDTNYYLQTNPDVKNAGINPLVHYIRFGKKEGRPISSHTNHSSLIQANQENYFPKVSVIVPNYNHASFLEERMASIYKQTYQNIEVILLDDCSTDNSVAILKKYKAKFPEITRCYINDTNSGSPFSQWKKGISLAKGDLIWIAESDDSCDKDFLEKLVPYFSDDSIILGYAHTIFIDHTGDRNSFTFESYIAQIDPQKWNTSYSISAHDEVNSALGLLNTIPNVSSVVFRQIEGIFPLFNDPEWQKMQVCGDWLFYLNLIRGGRIAFCRETHGYYRIYESSTSKSTHTQYIYYQEHERVACAVARMYKVSDDLLIRQYVRLKDFYLKTVENGTVEKFETLFDINKILQCKKNRTPNVLMATFAFAFGGGEIVPIQLANAMKDKGVSVTFFNGGCESLQQGVRNMLYSHIPVIHRTESLDVGSVIKSLGIEIIHTHHASMENYFAEIRLNDSTGTKHVATMHGMYEMMDDFTSNTKDILKSVDFWFYLADKNIIPFKERGIFTSTKFMKIINGMQLPEYHKIDLSSLGITKASFTACLASRAAPEKGWMEAIKAIENAREITKEDLHLILLGEGPVYNILAQEQLPSFVHLLGYKSNVCDYLASVQLGLLPSYFKGESYPLVLIEFFMAGLPVVASNIGEIFNMITLDGHKKAGILIELHDDKVNPDELAAAIVKMCRDVKFYNECVASARLMKERYNIDNVAEQYLNVYMRIVGL
jgi:glycosyltransferase involved in cell wall biosynthesis